VSYETIKEAVKKVDDSILTPERVAILIKCVPTDSEVELVNSYSGSIEDLGNAEQFAATISEIPRFRERIQSIVFRRFFADEISEVVPDLDCVQNAIEAVRSCERFKRVLQIVLVIGNYLNSKTFRGNAHGFFLNSLQRLKDLTCSEWSNVRDRAPTLLHYVARRLEEVDTDLLDLRDELAQTEVASKGKELLVFCCN
jgi:hypothetical protein